MKNKNFKLFKQLLQRGLSADRIRKMDCSDFSFDRANFAGARFDRANFDDARFDDARFYGARFDRANFAGANFAGANFAGANFAGANFAGARFDRANFDRANFAGARFYGANFADANFAGARFAGARFDRANFDRARFAGARFDDASFDDASFYGANINESTFGLTINCPEKGSFIAFKKASGRIVTLRIEEDSKRSSATTYKCRGSKVTTLEIEDGLTEIASNYDSTFIYRVGETIEIKDFDENRWNECSTGIHFFMNRKMAECYN